MQRLFTIKCMPQCIVAVHDERFDLTTSSKSSWALRKVLRHPSQTIALRRVLCQGFLEAVCAIGENKRVTEAVIEVGLDGSRFMDDSGIIHQEHGPRFLHREPYTGGADGVEDAGFATTNTASSRENYGNEIHAVAMSAFRRRATDAICSIDAELMSFDEPLIDLPDLREQRPYGRDQLAPDGRRQDLRLDGLEPAFQATVQCVI